MVLPAPTSNRSGFALALIGSAALLSPILGMLFTALAMVTEFDRLTNGPLPDTDPGVLTGAIGHVLLWTSLSYVLSLLGALAVVLSAHHLHYRAPWLITVMGIGLILWLPAFPIGTLLGLAGLVVLIKNKAALSGVFPPGSDSPPA